MATNIRKPHPLIPYFGGKSRVARKIIAQFSPHRTYGEVFAGGLSVLLQKERSAHEIVNDFDTELANLYKVAKFRLGELCEAVDRIPSSRQIWEELLRTDPTYLNEVYRAVRKIYILRLSFGGRGYHFGMDTKGNRFKAPQLKVWLDATRWRPQRGNGSFPTMMIRPSGNCTRGIVSVIWKFPTPFTVMPPRG